MSQVNPPFLLKKLRPREAITKSLKYKDESGNLVDAGPEFNNYLDQLERFAEQMYRRVGGSTDAVAESVETSDLLARIAQIEYEIADNPFTMDSTGWTMDTTYLTMDMSKA